MLGVLWCKPQQGMAGLGEARPVPVACGRVRWGLVNAADGSTEGASPLCCSLRRVVMVRRAWVSQGQARRSVASSGRSWLGYSCRRQHWGACSPLLLSTEGG